MFKYTYDYQAYKFMPIINFMKTLVFCWVNIVGIRLGNINIKLYIFPEFSFLKTLYQKLERTCFSFIWPVIRIFFLLWMSFKTPDTKIAIRFCFFFCFLSVFFLVIFLTDWLLRYAQWPPHVVHMIFFF